MNIFNDIGALAVATRLQRLADQFRKDGLQIYRTNDIEFEPKWFPIVYALHLRSPLSILELSEEIGYAHPSTIGLLRELEKEDLVTSFKDQKDERKRLIKLTPKTEKLIERMEPVWSKMTVSKTMRGKKIGRLLGNAILLKAREIGAKKVILNSNRKGSAAGVSLYLKLGFVEVPILEREYKRADIKMELDLN